MELEEIMEVLRLHLAQAENVKKREAVEVIRIFISEVHELETIEKKLSDQYKLTQYDLQQLKKAATSDLVSSRLAKETTFLDAYINNRNKGIEPEKARIADVFFNNVDGLDTGIELLCEELEKNKQALNRVDEELNKKSIYYNRLVNKEENWEAEVKQYHEQLVNTKHYHRQVGDKLRINGILPEEALVLGNLKWFAHQKHVNPLQVIDTLYKFYSFENFKKYSEENVEKLNTLEQIRERERANQSSLFLQGLEKIIDVSLEQSMPKIYNSDQSLTQEKNNENKKTFEVIGKMEKNLGNELCVVVEALRKAALGPFQVFKVEVSEQEKDIKYLLSQKKHADGAKVSALILKTAFAEIISDFKESEILDIDKIEGLKCLIKWKKYIPFINDFSLKEAYSPEESDIFSNILEIHTQLSDLTSYQMGGILEWARTSMKQWELINEKNEYSESVAKDLGGLDGKGTDIYAEARLTANNNRTLFIMNGLFDEMRELLGENLNLVINNISQIRVQAERAWSKSLHTLKGVTTNIEQRKENQAANAEGREPVKIEIEIKQAFSKDIQEKLRQRREEESNGEKCDLKKQFNIDNYANISNFRGHQENWNAAKAAFDMQLTVLGVYIDNLNRDARAWNSVAQQLVQEMNAEGNTNVAQIPSDNAERKRTNLNNINQQYPNTYICRFPNRNVNLPPNKNVNQAQPKSK